MLLLLANENKTLHVGDDYNTAFDPNVFLSTYYSDIVGCADEGNLLKFMMDFLHDIFSDGNGFIVLPLFSIFKNAVHS